MFEAVQRNGALPFHRFFVVGVPLDVFVAYIFAARGRQLFTTGGLVRVVFRRPANTCATARRDPRRLQA